MSEFINIPDIIGDPRILQWTKDNFNWDLVEKARRELLPPGVSETPGFQEGGSGEPPILPGDTSLIGGGGFIDSYTTHYEENRGCVLNSAIIANVRKYCKELQKHPKFKGKSCEDIIVLLTDEIYRTADRIHTPNSGSYIGDQSRTSPQTGSMGNRRQIFTVWKSAYWLKNELMKKYGIKTKKYRIFGYTPTPPPGPPYNGPVERGSPTLPLLDIIPPGANIVLPTATQTWVDAQPWGGRGGGPLAGTPPPRNVCSDASSCCPPLGCDVIVMITGHAVAGKITQCNPLIIKCEEHPYQLPGVTYEIDFTDSWLFSTNPPPMVAFGHDPQTAVIRPDIRHLPEVVDVGTVQVQWIICLC